MLPFSAWAHGWILERGRGLKTGGEGKGGKGKGEGKRKGKEVIVRIGKGTEAWGRRRKGKEV